MIDKHIKIDENLEKIKILILEVFPDVRQVSLYGKEEGYKTGKNNEYLCLLKGDKELTFNFKKLSNETKP